MLNKIIIIFIYDFNFQTVKAFLPTMMEKNSGHIVSIASLAGHVGVPKLVDYCASKFAAVGFDEALRMELEVFHIFIIYLLTLLNFISFQR